MELALDSPWTRVSELIARETGLNFPPDRLAELKRGIEGAANELGFASADECANWILSPEFTRKDAAAVARFLTIGETYFFRDSKTFDVLAHKVLAPLIQRRKNTRTLTIWSAACCTGQEPYSISVLLHQLIPDLADWNITIFGTDINREFLGKAISGIYGDWSFRETPDWFRQRYFEQIEGRRWAILPEIKRLVTFLPLNLVDEQFPFPFENRAAMDLILCRNVLMYFSIPQARAVITHLRKAIRDDGWLVAGPSEGTQVMSGQFEPVNFPGVILYRPTLPKNDTTGQLPPQVVSPAGIARAPKSKKQPVSQRFAHPAHEARGLANAGDLAAALACCDRWIMQEKLNASAYYLRAVILQELGDASEARRSLDRALYLNPHHIISHFTLANLARSAGKQEEAKRHFDNTLALLANCRPEDELPESDGITVARLEEIIRSTR